MSGSLTGSFDSSQRSWKDGILGSHAVFRCEVCMESHPFSRLMRTAAVVYRRRVFKSSGRTRSTCHQAICRAFLWLQFCWLQFCSLVAWLYRSSAGRYQNKYLIAVMKILE